MSLTVKLTESISEGNTTYTHTQTYTVDEVTKIEEAVAAGASDDLIAFVLDISECKAFYMVSDQDVTVETNSASTPTDSFDMSANIPVVWKEGDTAVITADVTALYVTNDAGVAATLKILVAKNVV